jgi:hypothetical protein
VTRQTLAAKPPPVAPPGRASPPGSTSLSIEDSDEWPPAPGKKEDDDASGSAPAPKLRGRGRKRPSSSGDEWAAPVADRASADEPMGKKTRGREAEQKVKPKVQLKKPKRQSAKQELPKRVEPEMIQEEEELPVIPVRFEIEEPKFTPKPWFPLRPIQREMPKPF